MKLIAKKVLLKVLQMFNAPLVAVHTSQAVTGSINSHAGASVSVSVNVPSGYSVLAHVATWNTGVVGMLCFFDAYTTDSKLYLYQYNAGSGTQTRGTVHVLTLCKKNT